VITSTQVAGDIVNCVRGDWLRGGTGVIIAGALFSVSVAATIQSRICLEFLPKKFKKAITDERGDHGNSKIGSGKNISDCPSHSPLLPDA
jgi:hypothetical protein